MKKKFLWVAAALAAICCGVFSGCSSPVTVNTNGGSITGDLSTAEIAEIIKTKPEKEGYIFGGWYSDPQMTQLITENTDLSGIDNVYAKWITAEKKTYEVRADEAKITDSGRKKQKMDIVNLPQDYDYQGLMYAGYTVLEITFSFEIKESYDGYQYVFFYRDTDCVDTGSVMNFLSGALFGTDENDPSLLCGYQFEHSSGSKNENWGGHQFTTTINLADLKENLYIRYGASGDWEDTWFNRNVVLTVEPK